MFQALGSQLKDRKTVLQQDMAAADHLIDKNLAYYMSHLKPYYLEYPKYNDRGEPVRSHTPKRILNMFDPLPRADIQGKMNFFFMPYNNELHIEKYMTFEHKAVEKLP